MQFGTRFTTAIYAVCIISEYPKHRMKKTTSDVIAETLGINAVTVRRILGQLKKAGFIHIAKTKRDEGTTLVKPLDEITLLDVLEVVEPNIAQRVFKPSSQIAKNNYSGICAGEVLSSIYEDGINAMKERISHITIADFLARVEEKEAAYPHGNPRVLFSKQDK